MASPKSLAAVIAGVALTFSAFAAAPPARAALSECPSSYLCLFGNNCFNWKIASLPHGQSAWRNLSGDYNDEMDSWANRSAVHDGCAAVNANSGGTRLALGRGASDGNVAPWNSDVISSYKSYNRCR